MVGVARLAVGLHLDPAVLSDGERFAQQERHAAERQVAREDLVRAAGVRAVEHGERRLRLHRLAVLATAIADGLGVLRVLQGLLLILTRLG